MGLGSRRKNSWPKDKLEYATPSEDVPANDEMHYVTFLDGTVEKVDITNNEVLKKFTKASTDKEFMYDEVHKTSGHRLTLRVKLDRVHLLTFCEQAKIRTTLRLKDFTSDANALPFEGDRPSPIPDDHLAILEARKIVDPLCDMYRDDTVDLDTLKRNAMKHLSFTRRDIR